MFRSLLSIVTVAISTSLLAAESADRLPEPEYHRQSSDPTWLAQVVQFHGHLGPAVVAGARMGMIGVRAVGAKGYFDVEVTCEGPLAKPPQSCFLDGLQMGTGATLGKRTLHWVQADRIVVRIKNVPTGRTVELRPTPALLDLLASFKPQSLAARANLSDHKAVDEKLEAIARKIASMPDQQTVTISDVTPTATKGSAGSPASHAGTAD